MLHVTLGIIQYKCTVTCLHEIKTMQPGWLSNWLVKHDVDHRSLGFDHRGVAMLLVVGDVPVDSEVHVVTL